MMSILFNLLCVSMMSGRLFSGKSLSYILISGIDMSLCVISLTACSCRSIVREQEDLGCGLCGSEGFGGDSTCPTVSM